MSTASTVSAVSSRGARRLAIVSVAVALGLLVAVTSSAGGVGGARTSASAAQALHLTQIASFQQGRFPEGLAVSRSGHPFVSVTRFGATENDPGTARVVKVSRSGTTSPVGPRFNVGFGVLTGLAFDAKGRLYIADASYRAPGRRACGGSIATAP